MGSAPGTLEVLSVTEHTRVVRLHSPDGRTAIRKEPLGPGIDERVTHERAILRRLCGIDHIVQLAAHQPDRKSILLDDVPGVPLAQLPTPLDSSEIVNLMLGLMPAIATMHQHGVVHGDISPANILLADHGQSLYLVDFALAMDFAELRPQFAHPREIVGTLPYLAPEQTGRTGRSVDRRADLYALGATMYELATGRPPFGTGEPLRLIRDHLARPAVPPMELNPAVPRSLSEIIMHSLEKEPDNRYQTAEGLMHDLEQVHDGAQRVLVGENDVPLRLAASSRPVGRDKEIEALRAAFAGAAAGQARGLAVSGESGVGKSALVDELRPIATEGDGWFASGKFDRYRRDWEHDGVAHALRGLGRLLLAESEDEVAKIRHRLLQMLGPNAGLAAALPEFAALLKLSADAGDPLTARVRANRTAVEILRAVASRLRPVVFVVDDAQWAGPTPVDLLDQLLSQDEAVDGLLTVVIYREEEVRETDPLAPVLARWRRHPGRPEHLHITNLDRASNAAMIEEMLHAPSRSVADLADAVFGLTAGNPFETVQLLNGLRRDDALRPTDIGWWWDPATIERRLAREDVRQLTEARVDGLPGATRHTLQAMACLGSEVELHTLEIATGLSATTIQRRLRPALEDGLVTVAGRTGVRFQHDRLRDTALTGIPPAQLGPLRLRMARRLATQPELFAPAADQYLHVLDAVHGRQERYRAAELLRQAAEQSLWIGESLPAERMLSAAAQLTADRSTLLRLHTARHSALFRLGRLDEADEIYQGITNLSTSPYDRVEATRAQIASLTNRNRPEDAIEAGRALLGELGWAVPAASEANSRIDQEVDWCCHWINETSESDDLSRPDVDDPTILSAGALISAMMPACFFRDQVTMAWLCLASARIWADRGPTRTLVGAVGHVPWVLVRRRQDYRAGYRLMRRLLAVGERRGYEPDLSQARFLYAFGLCHWFNPMEDEISEIKSAREGLIRGGDLQNASYATSMGYLDITSTVDSFAAEAESALAFSERAGNKHAVEFFQPYRWLAAALRGDLSSIDNRDIGGAIPTDPVLAASTHVARALAAALLDDPPSLAQHSQAAMSLLPSLDVTYGDWQAHLVRAISLADQVGATTDGAAALVELDEILDWVAHRAADMPRNFRHMLSLLEAERAAAVRDFRTAVRAFDSALRDSGHRPWHRAYIAERSAKFMLANGVDHTGWSLLIEAREAYRSLGAQAKVELLDRAYPSLDVPTEPRSTRGTQRSSITAGAIDMLGMLAASRALSSATSIDALRSKVVDVLSDMTGATHVDLVVWNADRRRWLAVADDTTAGGRHGAADSVVRYVERTREPLIVADATRDARFARDPHFQGLEWCSVLAVPVLSRGDLRAILYLENDLISDAFAEERLEAIALIASQLAISLDNALLYASLEGKVAERTRQLALANERLAQLSITDPLTGLANRRRLAETLQEEWARARRTHAPLSLAMVDIDHFKRYNDEHGHRAGDRCLQRVASQLDRCVRDVDLVARYGGEEFAVVMPATEAEAAEEVAERMRIAVIDLREPQPAGQVVTVSIGLATLHNADQQTTDQLIERADAALYEAKRTGRNRVRAATPPDDSAFVRRGV
jgi:diguanylate cyclase (GGDEF)-like protein